MPRRNGGVSPLKQAKRDAKAAEARARNEEAKAGAAASLEEKMARLSSGKSVVTPKKKKKKKNQTNETQVEEKPANATRLTLPKSGRGSVVAKGLDTANIVESKSRSGTQPTIPAPSAKAEPKKVQQKKEDKKKEEEEEEEKEEEEEEKKEEEEEEEDEEEEEKEKKGKDGKEEGEEEEDEEANPAAISNSMDDEEALKRSLEESKASAERAQREATKKAFAEAAQASAAKKAQELKDSATWLSEWTAAYNEEWEEKKRTAGTDQGGGSDFKPDAAALAEIKSMGTRRTLLSESFAKNRRKTSAAVDLRASLAAARPDGAKYGRLIGEASSLNAHIDKESKDKDKDIEEGMSNALEYMNAELFKLSSSILDENTEDREAKIQTSSANLEAAKNRVRGLLPVPEQLMLMPDAEADKSLTLTPSPSVKQPSPTAETKRRGDKGPMPTLTESPKAEVKMRAAAYPESFTTPVAPRGGGTAQPSGILKSPLPLSGTGSTGTRSPTVSLPGTRERALSGPAGVMFYERSDSYVATASVTEGKTVDRSVKEYAATLQLDDGSWLDFDGVPEEKKDGFYERFRAFVRDEIPVANGSIDSILSGISSGEIAPPEEKKSKLEEKAGLLSTFGLSPYDFGSTEDTMQDTFQFLPDVKAAHVTVAETMMLNELTEDDVECHFTDAAIWMAIWNYEPFRTRAAQSALALRRSTAHGERHVPSSAQILHVMFPDVSDYVSLMAALFNGKLKEPQLATISSDYRAWASLLVATVEKCSEMIEEVVFLVDQLRSFYPTGYQITMKIINEMEINPSAVLMLHGQFSSSRPLSASRFACLLACESEVDTGHLGPDVLANSAALRLALRGSAPIASELVRKITMESEDDGRSHSGSVGGDISIRYLRQLRGTCAVLEGDSLGYWRDDGYGLRRVAKSIGKKTSASSIASPVRPSKK